RLPSATVMEFEKERFGLGHYTLADNQRNPYYVEVLNMHKNGRINDEELLEIENTLRNTDIRNDVTDLLYRQARSSQYSLNINGGSQAHSYNMSLGHYSQDKEMIGESWRRLNLNIRNIFRPLSILEINAGIMYSNQLSRNNGIN